MPKYLLPLGTLSSNAYFALYCLGMFLFQNNMIHYDRSIFFSLFSIFFPIFCVVSQMVQNSALFMCCFFDHGL